MLKIIAAGVIFVTSLASILFYALAVFVTPDLLIFNSRWFRELRWKYLVTHFGNNIEKYFVAIFMIMSIPVFYFIGKIVFISLRCYENI